MSSSNPELTVRTLAEQEAATYELPDNWQVGRQLYSRLAIDAAYSPDIDDALDITKQDDGSNVLHASIIDIGSLLYNQPRIVAHVLQEMRTRYSGPNIVHSMIPPRLSEDMLSLVDGQERPVLTSNILVNPEGHMTGMTLSSDCVITRRVTYEAADRAVRSPETMEGGQKLRDMYMVMRGLFRTRHGDRRLDLRAENEDGVPLGTHGVTASQIIVQEAMIGLGAMMTQLAETHDIPQIYRAHIKHGATDIPEELQRYVGRAFFTVEPHRHGALGLEYYARNGSPLRRIEDFVNQCNIAAFREGRAYPFPADLLHDIVPRLSRLENRGGGTPKPGGSSATAPQGPRRRHAEVVLGKFEAGTVKQNDLTDAIFGDLRGPERKLLELDRTAIEYIAKHIHLARAVINEAVARGFITVEPANPDNPNSKRRKLTDQFGNEHPFTEQRKGSLGAMLADTRLLGRIAGVEVEPQVPAHLTREGKILANGDPYLQKLSRNNELQYSAGEPTVNAAGETEVQVSVIINGKKHTRTGRGSKPEKAITAGAGLLIADLDLIDNPPPLRSHLTFRKDREAEIRRIAAKIPGEQADAEKPNPIVRLKCLFDKDKNVANVDYIFTPVKDQSQPRTLCTLSVTDQEGNELHHIEVEDTSIKTSKRAAAQWLLDSLTIPPQK